MTLYSKFLQMELPWDRYRGLPFSKRAHGHLPLHDRVFLVLVFMPMIVSFVFLVLMSMIMCLVVGMSARMVVLLVLLVAMLSLVRKYNDKGGMVSAAKSDEHR
jgi:hypothetical protein